jgi:hypothetical protein
VLRKDTVPSSSTTTSTSTTSTTSSNSIENSMVKSNNDLTTTSSKIIPEFGLPGDSSYRADSSPNLESISYRAVSLPKPIIEDTSYRTVFSSGDLISSLHTKTTDDSSNCAVSSVDDASYRTTPSNPLVYRDELALSGPS